MKKCNKKCGSDEISHSMIASDNIDDMILIIKNTKVILDADIARLYGVPTKALNQAVKRNQERFPNDFMFLLSEREKHELVTNCDHLAELKYSYQGPYAFTEQGIAMLSSVLKSKRAALVNIAIMRAFVRIRQLITLNKELAGKLSELEHRIGHHDQDINELFAMIGKLLQYEQQPDKKFGFDTGTDQHGVL